MAVIKPLKLKSEKVPAKKLLADYDCVAHVLVDTGVFHLSQPYSYLVPREFQDSLQAGMLVKVPFGRTSTEGVVLTRDSTTSIAGLKFIEDQVSFNPIITPSQGELFEQCAQRYGCSMWDIFRLAAPAFVKSIDQKFSQKASFSMSRTSSQIRRLAIEPKQGESLAHEIASIISEFQPRKTLIVVPDEKTLRKFVGSGFTMLSGESTKSKRYLDYLQANLSDEGIYVGLRSSIFLSLTPGDLLIIVDESDPNYYERHTPTYNVRDVALIRSQSLSTVFLGYTHSLEVVRLMKMDYIESRRSMVPVRKIVTENPAKVHGLISEGLKAGSVLLLQANSGYVKSFSCNKCRNIARSDCGEKLILDRDGLGASCELCAEKVEKWRCKFCGESTPRALGKGVIKRAEDYARSFPGVRVIHSSGEKFVENLPEEISLVLATPGMEPDGEYSTILLMDGEQVFGRTGLRADEQGELFWVNASSKLKTGGVLYISLPNEHPISQCFLRGSFTQRYEALIAERTDVQLPPEFRLVVVESTRSDVSFFARYLQDSAPHGPVSVIGPMDRPKGLSRIIIKSPVEEGNAMIQTVYEFNRVRSLQGESILRVSVDPYEFI